MKKSVYMLIITPLIALIFIGSSFSSAGIPTLSPPPSTLPGFTYYIQGSQGVHYTITDVQWKELFTDVFDNSTYVSYNWSTNVTQYLIVFDLSYTGLNPYGMQFVLALSQIGFDSVANMSKAFNMTKNDQSQISGYTNIQALDAGAYPGFSWSVPIKKASNNDLYYGVLIAIAASVVVLYYVFNRKK
ncbi:MAG: hypothetical protein M1605_03735 [Candidatus Thermoplasmatota archaeon]|nr:hypothetical protein [Candidatus Thermoplasmatota archaeon]